jgi:hypothetical protein
MGLLVGMGLLGGLGLVRVPGLLWLSRWLRFLRLRRLRMICC